MSYRRPTSFAAALINAAVDLSNKEKVDHQSGQGNWIARRVIMNCDRPGFAEVYEQDKRPVPSQQVNAE